MRTLRAPARAVAISRWRAGLLLGALTHGATLPAADSVALDKVEVTARTIGVPAAVTLYTGDFLTANGINDYTALAPLVPGLFIVNQSVENVSLNLRGLNSDSDDPREQPRVSVFQDGVPLNNSHGNSVALFDVADVAVFKGPQPTQFSAGVQSGALVLTSNRATSGSFGSLTLGAGDLRAASLEAVVNRPLVSEKLFARVAVYANRRDGYVENRAGGPDLQGEGTVAVRASLRAQPNPATTADLIFNYQRDDTPGIALKSMQGIPGLTTPGDTSPYTGATLNRGSELGVTRTITSATALVSHKLDEAWMLSATAAWRDVKSNHEFDGDGAPGYLIEAGEPFHARQFNGEVRLAYDHGGPTTVTLGADVFWTKDHEDVIIRTDENLLYTFLTGARPPIAFNPRYAEHSAIAVEDTAGEVFGRVEQKVTDRLTLGGGLRLTHESLTSRFQAFPAAVPGRLAGVLPGSGGSNNVVRDTQGELQTDGGVDSWSGQVDARYTINAQLVPYVTVSRGRRRPVFDFDAFTYVPQHHPQETVWNYEAGVKGASASRRFRYEASVFQYDFEHFQTQRVVNTGVAQVFDGGRARGRGAEATTQIEITHDWTMFAAYGYTDAQFRATDEDGRPQVYSGYSFRLTSRHVATVGGTVSRTLAEGGAIFFTPFYTYRSGYFFEDNNGQNGGILHQGGYGLANVRLGYRPRGGRWEITGSVINLFEKRYLLDAGNIGGTYGIPTAIPAAPRELGVKLGWRW